MHSINSSKDNFKTKLLEQIILLICTNLKVTNLVLVLNSKSLAIQDTLLLSPSILPKDKTFLLKVFLGPNKLEKKMR